MALLSTVSNRGSSSLKDLVMLFRQHSAGLISIFQGNANSDRFSQCIMYWFLNKCDKSTHNEWERKLWHSKKFRALKKFFEFMEDRSSAYQSATIHDASSNTNNHAANVIDIYGISVVGATTANWKWKYCIFCKSREHYIPAGLKYRELSTPE